MTDDFCLIDFISQRKAVKKHLKNLSKEKKLFWLASKGVLTEIRSVFPKTYKFRSFINMEANFFFNQDEIIFVADHTTFV